MSTKITAENGAEIEVCRLGITVDHPEGTASIWARLTGEQRSALAAALAAPPAAGQWTRADLPGEDHLLSRAPIPFLFWREVSPILDRIVAHLNAHHPKPELSAMDYAEIVAFEAARATRAEQKCDELRSLIEGQKEHVSKSQRERDRWKAATKRALEHRDEWKTRAEKAERDRDEADRRTAAAEADRNRWKLHHDRVDGQWAKAEREVTRLRGTGTVSRADIEKVVEAVFDREAGYGLGGDKPWPGTMPVASAVWDYLKGDDPAVCVVRESDLPTDVNRSDDGRWFVGDEYAGHENSFPEAKRSQRNVALAMAAKHEAVARAIEAEQAVDPVEGLTDNLADILYRDELVTDQMRGVLERVVRAGMLLPEQEADR